MPSRGKRAFRAGVIDLTGSDEENDIPQRKHPRISASSSSQLPSTAPTSVRDQWLVGENGEEGDIIDLSQDVEEGFGWVCLGAIDGKIVGIRYYHGYATPGEQVMIRREPGNPYDSNAIRVNNVQGTQIGHLPRQLAEKLAPYLVSPSIVVEFSRLIGTRRTVKLSFWRVLLRERRGILIARFFLRSMGLANLSQEQNVRFYSAAVGVNSHAFAAIDTANSVHCDGLIA
jgi:hypothetical protein